MSMISRTGRPPTGEAPSRSPHGAGFGLPPPDTGNPFLDGLSSVLTGLIHLERRFDPFFRPAIDRVLRQYQTLSALRQQMNGVQHYEPTGDEVFPAAAVLAR